VLEVSASVLDPDPTGHVGIQPVRTGKNLKCLVPDLTPDLIKILILKLKVFTLKFKAFKVLTVLQILLLLINNI